MKHVIRNSLILIYTQIDIEQLSENTEWRRRRHRETRNEPPIERTNELNKDNNSILVSV